MRICRVCKGMPDPAGYCPKCDKHRTDFELIELHDITSILYALYVDYVRRFHEQDAPTMLTLREFVRDELHNREFMERLLSMYGMQHRLKDYYGKITR